MISERESTDRFVACTVDGLISGGRNVLYANGNVVFYSDGDFRAKLQSDENKLFAAALAESEGK